MTALEPLAIEQESAEQEEHTNSDVDFRINEGTRRSVIEYAGANRCKHHHGKRRRQRLRSLPGASATIASARRNILRLCPFCSLMFSPFHGGGW